MSSADPTRGRRTGFTLIELLIALLIGSILMTVVFQMISGQSRVVAVQSYREEAQQNVRGALEVISADLRGTFPAGIVEAEERRITFMQPRAWGIICGVAGTTIDAVFPITGGPVPDVSDASGVIVNTAAPQAAATWFPDPPARAPITDVNVLPGGPTAGLCNSAEGEGAAEVIQITTDAATAAEAIAGNQIATYHMTRYDLAAGDDGAWWIRRSLGMTGAVYNMQPLAGPTQSEDRGLLFQYFADAGTLPMTPVPGTNTAELTTIRMISVAAMTRSTQRLNGDAQLDSGSVRVMLRNAQ